MLTRSHARAMAMREAATSAAGNIVVSSSDTDKGTHTRWSYSKNKNGIPSPSSKRSSIHTHLPITDSTPTYLLSGSLSSISSEESSSDLVITPNSSFNASIPATPQRSNEVLTTPPRLSPKTLQRSPRGRWVTENGMTRLIFVEDSEERAKIRDIENAIRFQRIEERELEILLRERDIAKEKNGNFDMDVETETTGTWQEQEQDWSMDVSEVSTMPDDDTMGTRLGLAPDTYIRGDTAPLEEPVMAERPRRVQPLGPHGTELVDPVTFRPYSMESIQSSHIETWRQGVL